MMTYKQRVAASFDRRVAGYDGSRFHRELAARLLELAELLPGEQVLDVATGTGLVALAAAGLVGERGRVLGIDISAGMIARARQNASDLELSQVSFEGADAEEVTLDGDSYDAILCCSALIYLKDISRALRNWHSALRTGGKLAFTCFSDTAFRLSTMFRTYAATYGLPLASPNAPCGSALQCERLVRAAGFERFAVSTEFMTYTWALESEEEAWRQMYDLYSEDIEKLAVSEQEALKTSFLQGAKALLTKDGPDEQVLTFFVVAQK